MQYDTDSVAKPHIGKQVKSAPNQIGPKSNRPQVKSALVKSAQVKSAPVKSAPFLLFTIVNMQS